MNPLEYVTLISQIRKTAAILNKIANIFPNNLDKNASELNQTN